MNVRKAEKKDISAVTEIYGDIHTAEESGNVKIGWIRGVYPVRETAEAALGRGDLFVMEDGGAVVGTGIINRMQVESYRAGNWHFPAEDSDVMVQHTLVISPHCSGKGYGKAFVAFYENYARENGCHYLRIDTNARNSNARAMYKKLGYAEIGIVPTVFNGIPDVQPVLLEKKL